MVPARRRRRRRRRRMRRKASYILACLACIRRAHIYVYLSPALFSITSQSNSTRE